METDIFTHIRIIIYKVKVCKNDKATHFFVFNLMCLKISVSIDAGQVDLVSLLSDRTSEKMIVLRELLYRGRKHYKQIYFYFIIFT
jgi:hypothetical protein